MAKTAAAAQPPAPDTRRTVAYLALVEELEEAFREEKFASFAEGARHVAREWLDARRRREAITD